LSPQSALSLFLLFAAGLHFTPSPASLQGFLQLESIKVCVKSVET
jgi:hypothetical protein